MSQKVRTVLSTAVILLLADFPVVISAAEDAADGSRYVIAAHGLRLRNKPDRDAKTIRVMPYGEKVKRIDRKGVKAPFKVDNIPGHWQQVSVNGRSGYAFSGYLSHYPPPAGEDIQQYASQLKRRGFNMDKKQTEYDGSGDNHPGVEVELVLNRASMAEAFLIGKQLFGIPDTLPYPGDGEKQEQTYSDPDKPKRMWTQDLVAMRDKAGRLQQVRYYKRAEGWGISCFIKRQAGGGVVLVEYQFSD